jgi:hypothetical protein
MQSYKVTELECNQKVACMQTLWRRPENWRLLINSRRACMETRACMHAVLWTSKLACNRKFACMQSCEVTKLACIQSYIDPKLAGMLGPQKGVGWKIWNLIIITLERGWTWRLVLKLWQLVTFYLDRVSGHRWHDSPLFLSSGGSQNFNLPAF